MNKALLTALAAGALIMATPAHAHLIAKPTKKTTAATIAAQKKNLSHARYVTRHGSGHVRRWHRKAVIWISRERRELRAATSNWRLYLFRLIGPSTYHGCALPLIGRESGGVVTRWNYGGSGAYGLGQAKPASKMAAYGADYMTNGVTQIKWMNAYVSRYGGWCGANAFQSQNGWY